MIHELSVQKPGWLIIRALYYPIYSGFVDNPLGEPLYHDLGVSIWLGLPQFMDGSLNGNPNLKWIIARGTPISGNLHLNIFGE